MADTIVSVELNSPGSPSPAAVGSYPIYPSGIRFSGSARIRYSVRYVPGTMTVTASPPPPSPGPPHRQTAVASVLAGSGTATSITCTATFGSNVASGSTIIVGFTYGDNQTPTVTSVTDTLGTTYSHATIAGGSGVNHFINVYYGRAGSAGADAVTVTLGFTGAPGPGVRLIIAEFSGIKTSGPLGATDTAINTIGGLTTHLDTAGQLIPFASSADLYVSFVTCPFSIPAGATVSYVASDGFTVRRSQGGFPPGFGNGLLFLDSYNPTSPRPGVDVEPTLTWTTTGGAINRDDIMVNLEFFGGV